MQRAYALRIDDAALLEQERCWRWLNFDHIDDEKEIILVTACLEAMKSSSDLGSIEPIRLW